MKQKSYGSGLVCTCNLVRRDVIEKSIARGCKRMEQIFTATTAGVGQCGGSCRPEIQKMLDQFLTDGTFPQAPSPKK